MKKLFPAALLAALLAFVSPASATNLCTLSITTALTGSASTAVNLGVKPQALSIQAKFVYVASAATSADVYVETTIDGTNWIDIANFHYTTSNAQQFVNVSGMTAVTTPTSWTDGSIASNTTQAGVLGTQFRCKTTTVGTYGAGTTFTIDVQPR